MAGSRPSRPMPAPVRPAAIASAPALNGPSPWCGPNNRDMHRLLLIDDDEALAGPLTQYLARFDLQLESVTRPSAALQRLAAERFDALILDGMLPEMDGFEFC